MGGWLPRCELDASVIETLGKDNVHLHNELMLCLLNNAQCRHLPAELISQVPASCRDLVTHTELSETPLSPPSPSLASPDPVPSSNAASLPFLQGKRKEGLLLSEQQEQQQRPAATDSSSSAATAENRSSSRLAWRGPNEAMAAPDFSVHRNNASSAKGGKGSLLQQATRSGVDRRASIFPSVGPESGRLKLGAAAVRGGETAANRLDRERDGGAGKLAPAVKLEAGGARGGGGAGARGKKCLAGLSSSGGVGVGVGDGGGGGGGLELTSSSTALLCPTIGGGGAESEGEPSEAQLLDEIESHFGAGSDLWQPWSAAATPRGGPCEGDERPLLQETGRKRLASSEDLVLSDDRARRMEVPKNEATSGEFGETRRFFSGVGVWGNRAGCSGFERALLWENTTA